MKIHLKPSYIIAIILILLFSLIPTAQATLKIYKQDGIWTDDFIYGPDENASIQFTDCQIHQDGYIILNRTDEKRTYNFRDDRDHQARWDYFGWPLIANIQLMFRQLPWSVYLPDRYTRNERTFDSYDVSLISRIGSGEAFRPSYNRKYVYHHFRFNIDIAPQFINQTTIKWRGKANDAERVTIYYYQYLPNKRSGYWAYLESSNNVADLTYIVEEISKTQLSNAMNDDYIIDIYVLGTAKSTDCILYTDYIEIKTELKKAYLTKEGIVETIDFINPQAISKSKNFYWEQLSWDDLTETDTDIRYQLLYNNDGTIQNISDEYLPGNEEGFTTSPVFLNDLNSNKFKELKIRAILTSNNPNVSPKLYRLTLTWQNDATKWQDYLNTRFRIDAKNRLILQKENGEGFLNLSDITGDWPFVGYDIQNTHATDALGPKSSTFWWKKSLTGTYKENRKVLTPVIRDGGLYTTFNLNHSLYYYPDIEAKNAQFNKLNFQNDKDIKASPVLSDEYIIVATAEKNTSIAENYIYFIERRSHSNISIFNYGKILYTASPIVDDNILYITSGDPETIQSNPVNRILAIGIDTKSLLWEFQLPQPGESTPAIWNDRIIACCNSKLSGSGKTVFALDKITGQHLWNKSIGNIGKSSPVVYNDTVFITSKDSGKIKITAVNPQNGSTKWAKAYGSSTLLNADSTPAVYDGTLYVVLPEGQFLALSSETGERKWGIQNLYSSVLYFLTGSPCYADGMVYVGTPPIYQTGPGELIAIDTQTQKTAWRYQCSDYGQNPVFSSPVVANGLVFFGDEWNNIYSVGKYDDSLKSLKGSVISIPIQLPKGYWWDKFFAGYELDKNRKNNIKFSLLDENKKTISTLTNGQKITLDEGSTSRIIRLRADFSAENITVNPRLYNWTITFTKDEDPPVFYLKSFTPGTEGWLNEIASIFTIDCQDFGTGLMVSSVKASLRYETTSGQTTRDISAICSGFNGTTARQTIVADISNYSFFSNITSLKSITFSITDLANNLNSTTITFRQDTIPPRSSIDNNSLDERYAAEEVRIKATANDPGDINENASGVHSIELRYRYSDDLIPDFAGDWIAYDNTSTRPFSWIFTPVEGSGWYEFITIATDVIGNIEDVPDTRDASFVIDPVVPDTVSLESEYWFATRPSFQLTFTDDFILNNIEYKPNFETTWTTIASDINSPQYRDPWSIKTAYWDQMNDGETYFIHLQITDYLGNTRTLLDPTNSIRLYRDTDEPNVAIEIPSFVSDWGWDDTITITGFANDQAGSGIETVDLEYSYSEDNNTWTDWKPYEGDITTSDIEWEFTATNGNGYYRFRITAYDYAGNFAQSQIVIGINVLPITLIISLFVLLIFLILFAFFILWWRKNHPV